MKLVVSGIPVNSSSEELLTSSMGASRSTRVDSSTGGTAIVALKEGLEKALTARRVRNRRGNPIRVGRLRPDGKRGSSMALLVRLDSGVRRWPVVRLYRVRARLARGEGTMVGPVSHPQIAPMSSGTMKRLLLAKFSW